MYTQQPWNEAEATNAIKDIAVSDQFDLYITRHALDRMEERNLIMGDVLFALRNGFFRANANPSTRDGYYKYLVETQTPSSENREIGVLVVPDCEGCQIKVLTVMWLDETASVAGSIVGEEA